MESILIVLIVIAVVVFALLSGMADLTAIIATLVATRALPPRTAQLVCILGVLTGIAFGGQSVAKTVVELVDLNKANLHDAPALTIWLGGISGAVIWRLVARRLGIPTSATHAFVGSLCGATMVATMRPDLVNWGIRGVLKVGIALVMSPVIGFLLGFTIYRVSILLLRHATHSMNRWVYKLQVIAVLAQSYSYGMNDAQNTMGMLMGALLAAPEIARFDFSGGEFQVAAWVRGLTAATLAIGAMIGSTGVIRMLGRGLFHVHPVEALSGQAAAAISVFGASKIGAPVSSTQVMSSALVGVGGAWRPHHVRWQKVREILTAWVLTFPCAALFGSALTLLIRLAPGTRGQA